MSSLCKKLSKNIKEEKFIFPISMYNTNIGSIVVSAYILSENKEDFDLNKIKKTWKKIEKNPTKYIDFGMDDDKFIDKTLALFDMKRPAYFPIAMVISDFNMLFAPYIDDELYPLREDGFIPQTFKRGKIYPIKFA